MEVDGFWKYCTIHNSACKVIEEQTLWGQSICRIWLPLSDSIVRVPSESLRQFSPALQSETEAHRISYIAAAAKIAEILDCPNSNQQNRNLLAPMESNVIPLPHQITALKRVMKHIV